MNKPPKLTDSQKRRLKHLESALRDAVEIGKLQRAELLTHEIQEMLRPTGHEARLMQAKNWLFEAAMEAGNIGYAISGFEGVRKKVSHATRLYLEATALLAICYLRKGDIKKAQPLIDEALSSLKNIRTDNQRRNFRVSIVKRFEEEGMLAALREIGAQPLNIDEIYLDASAVAEKKTKEEIIILLGESTPPSVVHFLERVSMISKKQLSYKEVLFLPSHQIDQKPLKLGQRVFSSLKHVVWKSLCDPESSVYKLWFTSGMTVVFDKKYLTTAIATTLAGYKVGAYGMVVYFGALVLKMGLEVFCDVYKPKPLMGSREK